MKNIKAKRTFTKWREYGWILTFIIAFGGLYEPKLGLIVPFFIMTGLIFVSLFNGRFWCGNICPHGSLYDSLLLRFSRNENIPKILKSKILIAVVFILFGFRMTTKVYFVFSNFSNMELLDRFGLIFVSIYLVVLSISIPLGLIFSPRAWCQFCPMGTIQKIFSRLGTITSLSRNTNKNLTIINKDMCIKCGKCSRVCPMQLKPYLEFDEDNIFNDINCIKCNTCVKNCPKNILEIKNRKSNARKLYN